MKKPIRIAILLIAILLLLSCMAGCKSEEKQAELEKSVHEALYGVWIYYDVEQKARYSYILDYGIISQELVVTTETGEELDLSLGDSFSIRYKVVDEDEIAIYSTMTGEETDSETVRFELVDENTLILDGVTYTRYEEWIKTQE